MFVVPADGRQHALPPSPHPRGCVEADATGRTKAQQLERFRLPTSFIQSKSRHYLDKALLTSSIWDSSSLAPIGLELPPTLSPTLTENICSSDGAGHTVAKVLGLGWGVGREVINIQTLASIHYAPGTQRSGYLKLLTKGQGGTFSGKVEDNAHAQNSPQQ